MYGEHRASCTLNSGRCFYSDLLIPACLHPCPSFSFFSYLFSLSFFLFSPSLPPPFRPFLPFPFPFPSLAPRSRIFRALAKAPKVDGRKGDGGLDGLKRNEQIAPEGSGSAAGEKKGLNYHRSDGQATKGAKLDSQVASAPRGRELRRVNNYYCQ